MTARDRLALISIAVIAVLVLLWFALVAPERKQASRLAGQVQSARSELSTVQTEATQAQQAKSRYATDYASVLRLGTAVPSTPEVPALLYALEKASNGKGVDFSSITAGDASEGSSTTSSTTATGSTATAATPGSEGSGAGTFTSMPFTFIFEGGFFDLYHLLDQLEGFTARTSSGALQVSGRLLTIQSLELKAGQASDGKAGQLTGTVTATAYTLPGGQSVTGGATATAPATAPVEPTPTGSSAATAGVASTPAVIGAPR